jgi:cleavage and polyadenylation specificity factor subunit 3
MFLVEIDGVRVLYTGDYSTEKDILIPPAQIPNEKVDVLIVEGTYGKCNHESRSEREVNFHHPYQKKELIVFPPL